MKVIVCGSLGYGGADIIKWLQRTIEDMGFDVIDHIFSVEGMDYTHIDDFRFEPELVKKICEHDLEYVRKSDVMVVYGNYPSVGTTREMVEAEKIGIETLLYASEKIRSPWYMYLSDTVVTNDTDLYTELKKLEKKYD